MSSTFQWSCIISLLVCLGHAAINLKPWTGTCGACVFLNETHSSGCADPQPQTRAFVSSNEYWWYETGNMCLGPFDPTSEDKRSMVLINDQPTMEVNLVNMFNFASRFRLKWEPEKSSFATITWLNQGNDPGTGYNSGAFFVTNFNQAEWLDIPWPERQATLVWTASRRRPKMTRDECEVELGPFRCDWQRAFYDCLFKLHVCRGYDLWVMPDCRTDPYGCGAGHWGQYMTTGTSPDKIDWPEPFYKDPPMESVVVRRVWCTLAAEVPADTDWTATCGPLACSRAVFDCSRKPLPPAIAYYCGSDERDRNHCLNNGLCRCHNQRFGSQCEIELPPAFVQLLATRELPNSWRRPDEQIKSPSEHKPATQWDFWNCTTFDPCSGAGRCVDSDSPFEPPTCECYDGFFGSGIGDVDAFARAITCSQSTTGVWSDPRRYMLTHQCLLWRGPDVQTNWLAKPNQHHPAVPFTCTQYHSGPGCLPCPPCAFGNCTRMPTGDGEANVCLCDANHHGTACELQKCPLNTTVTTPFSSPCGAPVQGACVLNTSAVLVAGVLTTPAVYQCSCANGYTGPGCGFRLCALPTQQSGKRNQYMNESLVCSGPARGRCVQTSNASFVGPPTSECVCQPGYTGLQCELLDCPKASFNRTGVTLGAACNGLKTADGQSVCVNHSPYLTPYCECAAAADFARPGSLNRWWGPACDRPYNDTCKDPNDPVRDRWCHHSDDGWKRCLPSVPASAASDRRAWNLFPPVCVCPEETRLTGTWCQWSICGQRTDEKGIPVAAQQTCNGFRPTVQSGTCMGLQFPGVETTAPFAPKNLVETTAVGGGAQVQTKGVCHCQPAYVDGQRTMFMGDWCQTRVPQCAFPGDLADAFSGTGNATTLKPGAAAFLPCNSRVGDMHGACVPTVVPQEARMLGSAAPVGYMCRCYSNYEGIWCEKPKNVCQRPCRPGAGECLGSGICKCFQNTL